jgi:hypothetical protein
LWNRKCRAAIRSISSNFLSVSRIPFVAKFQKRLTPAVLEAAGDLRAARMP